MKNNKKIIFTLVGLASVLVFAGCSNQPENKIQSSTKTPTITSPGDDSSTEKTIDNSQGSSSSEFDKDASSLDADLNSVDDASLDGSNISDSEVGL
jgi:uncharacterized lipoprotein YajG